MKSPIPRRIGDRGSASIEYALLIAGVAVLVVSAALVLGATVNSLFERVHL